MRPNLPALRRRVARRLTETGTVTRPGEPVLNDAGTAYVDGPPTILYAGPLLVRPTAQEARVVEAGGAAFSLRTYDVHLPPGTTVAVDDDVTVTVCPYDAALVGVPLRVLDFPLDSWQIARKVVCVQQS